MNILRSLIYILQRESYDASRFLSFVYRDWRFWQYEKRQSIDWTLKARLLYIVLCLLLLLIFTVGFYFLSWRAFYLLLVILPVLPLLSLLSLVLLSPFDYLLKYRMISRAQHFLADNKIVVIGITGSYGKTSLKETLAIVLSSGFKIVKTPNNINTDLGIAAFILSHRQELAAADFFIVEMGAYKIGEIAKTCSLVKPQYSFLSGINEAHLERFGSLENTIHAKFELGERTAKKVILNFDDINIRNNYVSFKLPSFVGVDHTLASDVKILPDFGGLSFHYDGELFSTPWLAEHNITLIIMALVLAKELGLDLKKAITPLATAPFFKNRLEPIHNYASQLMIIDDSYNGNWSGFVSGLSVLGRATGRKLVITPGLVELGAEKESRHRALARLYAEKDLDLVILISNSATAYIIDEFQKISFIKYKVYPDSLSAHRDLASVLRAGDTIIFQNDWPDNYK
jgi:UDP-N-acetylmuramoyl-tripeptide--D-alanyl-D-alanine ligase